MDLMNIVKSFPPWVWALIVGAVVVKILVSILRSPKVKGAMGEKMVTYNLNRGLSQDYAVLNDVYLPLRDGTTTQIDHIVVSPYGIFVVETKNYGGWIFGDAQSKVWTQTFRHRKNTFQNPIRQNYLHLCTISDRMGIGKEYLRGVVAFIGNCTFKTPRPDGVVYAGGLVDYIRSFKTPIVPREQVPEIVEVIRKWQGTLSPEAIAAHVSNLKARHG